AAAVEARRGWGGADDARARLLEAARHRDARMSWTDRLDSVRQDLAFALRQLRAAPGVAAAAAITLALGIGANATMFGVIDRLLLRPPAYVADPSHTNVVYLGRTFDGVANLTPNISYTRYLELTRFRTSFSETAAFFYFDLAVGTGDATA